MPLPTIANPSAPVRKIGFVDLMKIQAPDRKAWKPHHGSANTLPLFTMETVDIVDKKHIIVSHENKRPFCSSCGPNKAAENAFLLLAVERFCRRNEALSGGRSIGKERATFRAAFSVRGCRGTKNGPANRAILFVEMRFR